MGFTRIKKRRERPRGSLLAALDVGTTKVVCLIARLGEDGKPRVVGIGHQRSQGLRAGTIVDMEAAETSIAEAVAAAEKMAGEQIREVVVNLSGGHPVSHTVPVDVPISGHEVGDADLRRAMRAHHHNEVPPDNEVIHAVPVSYSIDGSRGIRDPRGMWGERLGVDLHLITAGQAAVRNLMTCINRCHLTVEGMVVSPYAAGLAALVEDQATLGCAVIDMGGGTTGLSVFYDGKIVFADTIPVGGAHVTNDIARGLTTAIVNAERIKTLHGSCEIDSFGEQEMIQVPPVGEDEDAEPNQIAKSLLGGIIRPRMEEILELVRSRLEASGFDRVAGRQVVLTGGASQLHGVRNLATQILDKQVRLGRTATIAGLGDQAVGPAFATATGLLLHTIHHQGDLAAGGLDPLAMDEDAPAGLFGRLGGWLRANL